MRGSTRRLPKVSFLCLALYPTSTRRLGVFLDIYALTQRTNSLKLGLFPVISMPTLYILAAIHVTPIIDTPRMPSDSAIS